MRTHFILVVAVLSLNVAIAYADNDEWFAAVKSGNLEAVETLISTGADIEAVDYSGWTALLYASCVGNTEMAQLLIASGANVNAVNERESVSGQSVLMLASSLGGNTGFMHAVHTDASERISVSDTVLSLEEFSLEEHLTNTTDSMLTVASVDVNSVVDDGLFAGESALMHASWEGDIKTAELLIENGANINAVDNNGATSLDYAKISLERHSKQLSEGSGRLDNLEKVIALLSANGAESGKQDVN